MGHCTFAGVQRTKQQPLFVFVVTYDPLVGSVASTSVDTEAGNMPHTHRSFRLPTPSLACIAELPGQSTLAKKAPDKAFQALFSLPLFLNGSACTVHAVFLNRMDEAAVVLSAAASVSILEQCPYVC